MINKVKHILSSDLNKKIFGHSFWILTGNTVSKFSLLASTILMANFLYKNEYGHFGIIKSTILMFAMFAGLELGMTATKYISQYQHSNKEKIEKIIGLSNFFAIAVSILVSLFVYFFSAEIARKIDAPSLSNAVKISSFILFFSSLNGIQNGILAGLEKFKEISINTALAGVISSVLLVLASVFYDLNIIVIAFGSNYVVLFMLNFVILKKEFYSKYRIKLFSRRNLDEVNVLYKFSLPAILAALMGGPITWFCNYLLVTQPNGYDNMATFDIANQWRNTILFIPAALSQVALPMMSSKINNKDEYKMIFNKNLKINALIGFSFVLFFVVLSPVIVFFYGEKYSNALFPMILMFITTGFIAINNVIGQAIASQGKMWLGFYVNLLWAIVLGLCSYIFVVSFSLGAVGICIAYLISYVFHTFVQFLYIKRFL